MTRFYEELVPVVADRTQWTLPAILRLRAATHGDRVYLDAPAAGVRLTFAETLAVAERVASGLLERGHARGDRLVVMLPNVPDYLIAWFGSGLAGMAEVPINTAYRGSFLEHQISTVAPTGVVVAAGLAARFVESAAACGTVRRFYVVADGGDGGDGDAAVAGAVESLRSAGFAAEPFAALSEVAAGPLPPVRPQELASVFFTSGTTGLSKGVMMSHAHMAFEATECVSLTRLTDQDVYMATGPLFHGNAQFLAAYPALLAGARFVLRERFSASNWITWARESGATVTNFVGVMMDFVHKQPPSPADRDNALRCIFAAPTPASIAEDFKARFGVEAFVEVFGLTETAMPIMTPYGVPRPPGAAGLLVRDWFDVRLVDPDTDDEVPIGQVGELVVRPLVPFTMCSGYFGMPDRTVEAMRNCWFHTGDGLRRDEDGWYYFVDRLKDAIRRRGENISSYEVEQAILQHEAVAECAAIAVPADQEGGEDEVMVFVVLAPGAAVGAEDLWAFSERRLPYFAVPRYLRFVESLPRTPSEKIQKRELRTIGVDAETVDRVAVLGGMPART
ncbi:MAG TPA: AMP-binding protein [Acidimicrobiales bacterium]|nr:AMP-binding protein [Acidimicrobiales bacterium]